MGFGKLRALIGTSTVDPQSSKVPWAGLLPDEGPAEPFLAPATHQGSVTATPPPVDKLTWVMGARGVDPETTRPVDTAVVSGPPVLVTPVRSTATSL